jgi:hypothetical protein
MIKVKIWDLFKGSMCLSGGEGHFGKSELNIHSTLLNSMHPWYVQIFLNQGLVGTMFLLVPSL